jgi:CDP-diacylglycerol--glycerol-3-phosphate 3-phosphatidyltransferase
VNPRRTIYSENLTGGDLYTWANLVTLLRIIVGLGLFSFAAMQKSVEWNAVGLLTHWLLDTLDGCLARWFHQETRFGAQIDILADRIVIAYFCFNLINLHPSLHLPIVLFLFEFMGIDQFLSNQFIRWPINSPNYFHQVDRTIWLLNWSPAAKLLNSGLVGVLFLINPSPGIVLAVVIILIGVKVVSCIRLNRLPLPYILESNN